MEFALVTGGSGAIGKAICIKLAKMGYSVIVHFNSNEQSANKVVEEITNSGGKAETLKFDVSNITEVKNALTNWHQQHEEDVISVLVNNAGITKDTLMVWMEEEDWSSIINTNLNSFYYVTSQLLQKMVLNKWGRIVNIVSLSGQKGLPGQANYAASKAGVIGATKSLAQEVGKKKITVNAVSPGYIASEMTKDLDEKLLKKHIPVNRFGKAEEVAATVGFLVSDGAAYITGEVISVNGGLYT
jgi:3-oxoacyl-[acyl-carrier protein] reductase